MRSIATVTLLGVSCLALAGSEAGCREKGGPSGVELEVLDEQGRPLPSRVHLRNSQGKSQKPAGFPAFADHFVFAGKARLPLDPGTYRYEIERGPEYVPLRGTLEVGTGSPKRTMRLERIANLAEQGWYSGDLHIHRSSRDIELLMRAEDLHVGPLVTWGNDWIGEQRERPVTLFDGNRYADSSAGEDERYGGALLFFGLQRPLVLPPKAKNGAKIAHREGDENDEWPSPAEFARDARRQEHVHVDIEKPFWWDVPIWLAFGLADSIEIAHNHMNRSVPRNHEAWGRRCDRTPYGTSLLASGYCSQEIYYLILESGIRLPPSAGSASGVLPNPVGYNRVYVHVEGKFDYQKWWSGLKAGTSFVTNGPLLFVTANGKLAGHVFSAADEGALEVALQTRVLGTTPIRTVELVRDGKVVAAGAYEQKTGQVTFPPQTFGSSGWFLVRAIADRDDTFRFASTAPFFVEIGVEPRRVSRAAVRYFLTWVSERAESLRSAADGSDKLDAVIQEHLQAKRYWEQRLNLVNRD